MVAVSKGDTILVSGASGYISAHTVDQLLKAGYKVKGTVRDDKKGKYLVDLFKGKGDFDYVIVKDIGEPNAFDDAVKGVQGILHMASPFHFNAEDPKELIDPAINGTQGILKSTQKNNPDVKRIVVTSSVAAVMDSRKKPPHEFTEKDWNTFSTAEIEEKGKDAAPGDKYRASKTLAEQALWKFVKEEKPSWDAVTINPSLVLGPIIHQCDSPSSLNTSVAGFYEWQRGNKTEKDLPAVGYNWIDVRDCAIAHVKALEVPEAGGERFITSNGAASGNDFCVILNKIYPDNKKIPKGDASPETKKKLDGQAIYHNGTKTNKVLGVPYRSLEESAKDMAASLDERFGKVSA